MGSKQHGVERCTGTNKGALRNHDHATKYPGLPGPLPTLITNTRKLLPALHLPIGLRSSRGTVSAPASQLALQHTQGLTGLIRGPGGLARPQGGPDLAVTAGPGPVLERRCRHNTNIFDTTDVRVGTGFTFKAQAAYCTLPAARPSGVHRTCSLLDGLLTV